MLRAAAIAVPTHLTVAAALVGASLLATGCKPKTCVGGDADCKMVSPCQALAYTCPGGSLEIRKLEGDPKERPGGIRALGARGDVLIGNDQIAAVISGLGNQNYLDPGGGVIIDLTTRGSDNDALLQIVPVVGILPADSVRYTSIELLDERPTRVAVQLRGTLYQRPDRPVMTLYEVRPCEPGVRARTEIYNGSGETHLWALSDGFYWSDRSLVPFTPGDGKGFAQPSFDLLTIDDAFVSAPLLAASTHSSADPPAAYGVVACGERAVAGFHSPVVSSAGLPKTVVRPRATQVFDRFITVAKRADVAGVIDPLLEARRMLFGEPWATVSGRVEGVPGGSEREASVILVDNSTGTRVPWTQIVPEADGRFRARVPAGLRLIAELHVLGRHLSDLVGAAPTAAGTELDLGTFTAQRRSLGVSVVDNKGDPIDSLLFVVAADEQTRRNTAAKLYGRFVECSPWLGPPHGASPACNRVLVSRNAPVVFTIPEGKFHVYATHGPFWTIARAAVDTSAMPSDPLRLTLRPLALRPPGTVSADLHVHGGASFDSSIPDVDRVLAFAASDVELLVTTDHDVVHSYAETIAALGLGDRITEVTGVETTGHVPWMAVPGDPFPRVIGHYNFWPLAYRPGTPRDGAPFDEFVEPGELFDRVEPLFTGERVRQLNHPWAASEFGRDQGFPRAIALDLRKPLPREDDGTRAGLYMRRRGAAANSDHDVQEVMNGTANDLLLTYRTFWFYLLNQGILKTGTANSDSHGLTDDTMGAPRNLVQTTTKAGKSFDVNVFNRALKEGTVLGTNGPIIEATILDGDAELPYGMKSIKLAPGAKLRLVVSAPPWAVVDEVRVIVNGRVARKIAGSELGQPADPFGADGLERYRGTIPLSELLPPSGDAWMIVEAGRALPLAADLGGGFDDGPDGVPDTADNNGDGVVDARDVTPGELVGPLANPPEPPRDDPRYHFYQVVPGAYPFAFTNPFVIDRDANGRFDPPGVQP